MTLESFRFLLSCVVRVAQEDGWHSSDISAQLEWVENQLLRQEEPEPAAVREPPPF